MANFECLDNGNNRLRLSFEKILLELEHHSSKYLDELISQISDKSKDIIKGSKLCRVKFIELWIKEDEYELIVNKYIKSKISNKEDITIPVIPYASTYINRLFIYKHNEEYLKDFAIIYFNHKKPYKLLLR